MSEKPGLSVTGLVRAVAEAGKTEVEIQLALLGLPPKVVASVKATVGERMAKEARDYAMDYVMKHGGTPKVAV